MLGWFIAGKRGENFSEVLICGSAPPENTHSAHPSPSSGAWMHFPNQYIYGVGRCWYQHPVRNPESRKNTFGRDKLRRVQSCSLKARSLSSWIAVFTHIPGLWSRFPFQPIRHRMINSARSLGAGPAPMAITLPLPLGRSKATLHYLCLPQPGSAGGSSALGRE